MATSDERLQGLDHARELARAFLSAPVERVRGPSRGERGVSSSTVGEVVSYLKHHRDLAAFDRFLSRYPDLDRAWAQNQKHKKAERRALASLLREERKRAPARDAEDWLLILAWASRLMTVEEPSRSPNDHSPPRAGNARRRPGRSAERQKRRDPPDKSLGAMASAFLKVGVRRDSNKK